MNSVKRHTQYVDDLNRLVKDSTVAIRRALLDRLSFLAKQAKGNPYLFQRLVAADRKNAIRLLMPTTLKQIQNSRALGTRFGKDRASADAVV